jgi:two-component system, LytTR family, sensor kinase|tara:strand:+ start:11633 stop:12715 length:1083 start_codon:yes stop_codon:yes gene_type:complete
MSISKSVLFSNPTYNKISSIPIHAQIYFWLAYFAFNVTRWGLFYQDYAYSLKSNLIGFPIHIILCYLFIFIFLPKLFQGKAFEFFSLITLSLSIAFLLKFQLTVSLLNEDLLPEYAGITSNITFDYIIQTVLGEVYVITFVSCIKLVIDWTKQKELLLNSNKVLLENELKYLRSQIQPHFFFNTLNNLYSLTIDKSDKAPDLILKLSDLMKYFLYETGKEYQTLRNEIKHIKDYIYIEKLRYNEELKVTFNVRGAVKKTMIRPLLLIPLVENAFKHGARNSKKNSYITIDLKIDSSEINFKVENSFLKSTKPIKAQIGGIGLANIKKRLEINYGKENFSLDTYEEKNKYIAELKVKLKND